MTGSLRAREDRKLALTTGLRLLDVGCGLGNAGLALAGLGEDGELVAEMARVARAGALVSLIDSDWSTFAVNVGDGETDHPVREAM